jgi:hypothetical protein
MKIRRVVLASIAGTFLMGHILVGCSTPQCTYTNAITQKQFTAACFNNPGGGGGGGDYDHDDEDDHGY